MFLSPFPYLGSITMSMLSSPPWSVSEGGPRWRKIQNIFRTTEYALDTFVISLLPFFATVSTLLWSEIPGWKQSFLLHRLCPGHLYITFLFLYFVFFLLCLSLSLLSTPPFSALQRVYLKNRAFSLLLTKSWWSPQSCIWWLQYILCSYWNSLQSKIFMCKLLPFVRVSASTAIVVGPHQIFSQQ